MKPMSVKEFFADAAPDTVAGSILAERPASRDHLLQTIENFVNAYKTPDEINRAVKSNLRTNGSGEPSIDHRIYLAAQDYIKYRAKKHPYTFDEFLASQKEDVVTDAKKIYATLKTARAIRKFRKLSTEKRVEILPDIHQDIHTFGRASWAACVYATYAAKYIDKNSFFSLFCRKKGASQGK